MPGPDDHAWLRRISPQVNVLWRGWFPTRFVEPLRRIYDHELVVVEQGTCTVTIAHVEHRLGPGSFIIVPPGCDHVSIAGEQRVLRACVHFDWDWVSDQPPLPMWTFAPAKAIERLVRPAPAWVPRGPLVGVISELPEIGRLIQALFRRWDDPVLRPSARALLLELLVRLLACQPAIGSPLPGRQALAAAVREALERSIAEPVSVQDLLSGFACTYEHANRTFKAVFGLTPVSYLTRARIERARALLGQGKPLAETAAACGFSSIGYLSRIFRQHTGIAPSAYQRAAGHGPG